MLPATSSGEELNDLMIECLMKVWQLFLLISEEIYKYVGKITKNIIAQNWEVFRQETVSCRMQKCVQMWIGKISARSALLSACVGNKRCLPDEWSLSAPALYFPPPLSDPLACLFTIITQIDKLCVLQGVCFFYPSTFFFHGSPKWVKSHHVVYIFI